MDRLIGADIMGNDLWDKWIDAREKCTDENAQEVLVGLLGIIDKYARENERLSARLDRITKPYKGHSPNCDWCLDQYDFECTCGLIEQPSKESDNA